MELQNAVVYHSILKHFSHTFHTVLVRRNIKDWYKVCPLWEVSCLCMSFHNNLEKSWKSSTGTEWCDDCYFWKDYLTCCKYSIVYTRAIWFLRVISPWCIYNMPTMRKLYKFLITVLSQKERNWKWKAIVVVATLVAKPYIPLKLLLPITRSHSPWNLT